jgi:hypothetical protein
MTSTAPLKVTLEFRPDADPPRGRIVDHAGQAREFVGWIGLASALEDVLGATPHVPKEDSQ